MVLIGHKGCLKDGDIPLGFNRNTVSLDRSNAIGKELTLRMMTERTFDGGGSPNRGLILVSVSDDIFK